MGYVIAAYALVLAGVGGSALHLASERASLRKSLSSGGKSNRG